MIIALLAGANSIHTVQWANRLFYDGHDVHIITQHPATDSFAYGVTVHNFPFRGVWGYFLMAPAVRSLLHTIRPDIVNAHYASGYGTTARLVGYSPWVLSVWGSDVYDFPYKSPLHKWLLKKNLLSADAVASTSLCMGNQIRSICPSLSRLAITPFGVDMSAYVLPSLPMQPTEDEIVIGTVKTMSPIYGIDTLIESFALLYTKLSHDNPFTADRLKLRLVGGGPQTKELKMLAFKLGVSTRVQFVGRVSHEAVPYELAKLDIFVALSRQESFGVAIIEAGASGKPVVVSDAGGLPEVVIDKVTGLVVPRDNPQAAANAILQLIVDPDLRHALGAAGREHVQRNFSWPACVERMVKVYGDTINYFNKRRGQCI